MARRRRRRGPVRGFGRALGLLAFVPVASRAPTYARLIWALVADERIPAGRKALLAGAAGYLVLGRDLIPDDLPLLGGLDDLAVVVLAVDLFLDGVPAPILAEKLDDLGIERAAFDHDIAQLRRIMPAPVRHVVRRLPEAVATAGRVVGTAGQAIESTGLGPRLRSWIRKEGSLA